MNEYIYGINPEEEFDEDYEDEQEYWDWLYEQEHPQDSVDSCDNPFTEYADVYNIANQFKAVPPIKDVGQN